MNRVLNSQMNLNNYSMDSEPMLRGDTPERHGAPSESTVAQGRAQLIASQNLSKVELSEIASEFTVRHQNTNKIDEDSIHVLDQSRIDDQLLMSNPLSPKHIRRTLTQSEEEEKNSNADG